MFFIVKFYGIGQVFFANFAGELFIVEVQAMTVAVFDSRFLAIDPLFQALYVDIFTASLTLARANQGVFNWVSVPVFGQADSADILTRIFSFFLYLSGKLATSKDFFLHLLF